MQWQGRRQSKNVQDRRGMSAGPIAIGGGAVGLVVAVVVVLITLLSGKDLTQTITPDTTSESPARLEQMGEFVSVALADTEDYWSGQFKSMGKTYKQPTLVLFDGMVRTGSGTATSATGPFYSPADKTIYIDLSFYTDLQDRYGAGGDAAQAYVIFHEVGHAVQDQLGDLDQGVAQGETENEQSVRIELQADFYAGLVASYLGDQGWLDRGDIQEALNAANAIGDDRLQKQSQGYADADTFTHGTSAQRVRWFLLGYETGDITRGDTFSIPYGEL